MVVLTSALQKTGHAPYGSERPSVLRRNSKGKEKAAEKTDIMLSPSFSIEDSDDEDEGSGSSRNPPRLITEEPEEGLPASDPSPTILSKSWVEEEGEIFRRGNVLLGPDELEEGGADISSEELKREVGTLLIRGCMILMIASFSYSRLKWNDHGQGLRATVMNLGIPYSRYNAYVSVPVNPYHYSERTHYGMMLLVVGCFGSA